MLGSGVFVMVPVVVGGGEVFVTVGVAVFVARKPGMAGGESPVNHRTTKNTPTTSKTTASPPRMSGMIRWRRLRYAIITSAASLSGSIIYAPLLFDEGIWKLILLEFFLKTPK
jgi:hypothetical protein